MPHCWPMHPLAPFSPSVVPRRHAPPSTGPPWSVTTSGEARVGTAPSPQHSPSTCTHTRTECGLVRPCTHTHTSPHHRGNSSEPPPPPQALSVHLVASKGSRVTPRTLSTFHPSPSGLDDTGVTNSSELGPLFPISVTGMAIPTVAVSPHPLSLSLSSGTAGNGLPSPSCPCPSSLSLSFSLYHTGP